ncbi:hypothetical protein FNF27_06301 [Cafeteria roenbergensis]|uniref:Uncharacterized protein n=1 Tax=Cafeteria roenbergensis TaxID=33653 RepID=A0A5A8E637_CAFRO|nr:hypothetical protein FNF27_06301 [Cafeteria roenbergensis]
MPKAVTKSQSAAAAIPVREAPAKFPEPIMIWSSADIPREVAAPQSVPRTPFFLRSTHRCLLAEPVRAMAVVVDALIAMDCDISMESPEPSLSCTLIRPGGSCEFTIREWVIPAADDCELASVFELSRTAGDRYSFHDAFLRFSESLASAADASSMTMAPSCNDSRVAPIVPVDPAVRAAVNAACAKLPECPADPAPLPRADTPTGTLRGKDSGAVPRSRQTGSAATESGAGASVSDDEEADLLQTSFDVIASMLGSSRDDVREEGATRVVAAIMAGDKQFAGSGKGICRASLRRRDVGRKLINALVRAQAGSTCHSQAANALALMAQCSDCAADMIDNGAVFALASVIMVPCKRQNVRLRRNAARAISRLAGTSTAVEHAKACNVVPYLRFVVGHCPDRQFRRDAEAAADALDPAGEVSSVDVTGVDVEASSKEALRRARTMARGASV